MVITVSEDEMLKAFTERLKHCRPLFIPGREVTHFRETRIPLSSGGFYVIARPVWGRST